MKIYKFKIEPNPKAFYPKQCSSIVNKTMKSVFEGRVIYDDKEVDIKSILGLVSLAPVSIDVPVYVKIVTSDYIDTEKAVEIINDLNLGSIQGVYEIG